MEKHYLFIVNPNAGDGKAGKDWIKIEKQLINKSVYYKAVLTTYPGHALKIVEEELRLSYKIIIVVGGDGTLNEVVNGIFYQKIVRPEEIKIGIIPVGTGNDWARYYGIPGNHKKALDNIFSHKERYQDIGRVRRNSEGKEKINYFVNIAGFGFDSQVVKSVNRMKERGNRGGIAYLYNLIRCLFSYKAQKITLIINDEKIEKNMFSVSIGIGKYSGGGMKQTPNAIINDGLFDITFYDDMSVFKVLRNILRLYNGKIEKTNTVHTRRCKRIIVYNGDLLCGQTDGELISGKEFDIEILPSAIKVLI